MLKINPISDTHDTSKEEVNKYKGVFADVYVHCGDGKLPRYMRGKEYVVRCSGNHDWYGDSYDFVKVYTNQIVEIIHDTVFISCTLWCNWQGEKLTLDDLKTWYPTLNDFHHIEGLNHNTVVDLFNSDFKFIKNSIEKYKDKKIVIVTHFAPSKKSIHHKYEGDRANRYFVNDLDDFILANPNIKCWIHGHTHSSLDYKIGECRVICNPRGYKMRDGSYENPDFNPELIIEV